jgi:AsmA protein
MALNGGKLPGAPEDPARFNGYRGDMHFEIVALRYKEMDLSNMVTDIKMVDDLITVERFSSGVYGGKVVADGTNVRLGPAPEKRPFVAKVKAEGINMKQVLAARSPKQVMDGTFNGNVDLQGVGYTPDQLEQTLLGAINGSVQNGTFYGVDVVSKLSEPLAKAIPAAKALKSEDLTKLGENLPFGVEIKNGVAQLERPITWTRPEAAMSFNGGIRLDGTLDLKGTVNLTPATVNKLTGGRVTPAAPIPIAAAITGKAWSPEVTGLDIKPAAAVIAKQAAVGLAGQLLGDKAKPVQDIIQGGEAKARAEAEAKQRELEARAAEEKRKLEEAARAEQERQKKRLEEEARKKLRGVFGR